MTVDSQAIAIDYEMIKNKKDFTLKALKSELLIQYKEDGTVLVTDKNGKNTYQTHRSYWFAWYTFNPNTLLYK